MRKIIAGVLLGLGSFLLVAALVVVVWGADAVKKTPLDTDSVTNLSGVADKLNPGTGDVEDLKVKAASVTKADAELSDDKVVVFVNTDHPWHGRESIAIAELVDQPLILRETGSTTRRALEVAAAQAGVPIRPRLEIGSREGVWKAVERGLGIGVVADFEFVAHPKLATIRIGDVSVRTEYRLACLMERRRSPKIEAFLSTVLDGVSRTR